MSARRVVLALAAMALAVAAAARAAAVVAPADAASAPVAELAAEAHCPAPLEAPRPDEIDDALHHAADRGLMWKASKGGRDVFLYGTIHVGKLAWLFPGPRLRAALGASDTVAMELDFADPGLSERMARALRPLPDAPPLPPALAQRLQAQIAAACVSPELLSAMRFEMQAMTLDVLQGRQFGLYQEFGMDLAIVQMAKGAHKRVIGLETPELQIGLLVSDDPAETQRSVADVLDELEGGKSSSVLPRLAGDWERSDLADMTAYAHWCECEDTPQQRADYARLIDDRNLGMADKIVKLHADGRKLFVAVGALHMTGPVGLPALLAARGFKVERVAFEPRP